jgi:hypothetical protein
MPRPKTIPQIPLPKTWSTQVKSAVLHVIALAQYALIYSHAVCHDILYFCARVLATLVHTVLQLHPLRDQQSAEV